MKKTVFSKRKIVNAAVSCMVIFTILGCGACGMTFGDGRLLQKSVIARSVSDETAQAPIQKRCNHWIGACAVSLRSQ
jgi:hypothetical protein